MFPLIPAFLALGCDKNQEAETSPEMAESSTGQEMEGEAPDTTVAVAHPEVDDADFGRYDLDQDGRVSTAEWADVDYPVTWDINNDGQLNDIELSTGLYTAWDIDGNDRIDMVEFRDGSELWLDPGAEIDMSNWDIDDDGMLDHDELEAGLRSVDYWNAWDTDDDGTVDQDEMDVAVYQAWDTDDDGFIEAEEWRLN
ncbi:MAG TPA: hypothetical protein RMF84_14835 [Polyangiaceae bacterium LLY-WYZ-14_1]|nr:hypothetical protein [Polyangiaceae bacterium LLY-WYZ-14_1]